MKRTLVHDLAQNFRLNHDIILFFVSDFLGDDNLRKPFVELRKRLLAAYAHQIDYNLLHVGCSK